MEKLATVPAKGRPREFCVESALAAALRVFWRRGYEGASMAELTEEMGITKPSLYAAFGNKEALFRKALDLYEREKLAFVRSALEAPTARAVAERLLTGVYDMQTCTGDPKGCLNVISSLACGVEAESIREEVNLRRRSVQKALLDRFRRAKDEGDLPEGVEPEALTVYLATIIQGVTVQAAGGASPEQLKRIVDTTLAVWPTR